MITCWKSIFLLNLFITLCLSLYEDQVGKLDWKISHIGKVKYSKIDLDLKSPRVFVATESNVLASLNLKDGKIMWRKLLEKGSLGEIKDLFLGNEIVTISGNGPFVVRGWNKTNGLMLFEWSPPAPQTMQGVWTLDQSKAYQISLGDNAMEVTTYNLKSGNPARSSKVVTGSWLSTPKRCSIWNGIVSCVNERNVLTSFSLSDSTSRSSDLSFQVESVEPLENGCILQLSDGTRKAALFDSQGVLSSYDIPRGAIVSIGKRISFYYVNIVAVVNGKYEIRTIEVENKNEFKYTASHTFPFSPLDWSSSSCTLSNSMELFCYTLISSIDHAAVMLRKGKILWVREEALANIINVEMIDLPVSEEEAAIEKEFASKEGGLMGMISRRLNSQVLQIKNIFMAVLGLKDSSDGGIRKDLVRDPFGLHKLILVITSSMKVFGIDNEKGDIIWEFFLKDMEPFGSLGKMTVPFFVQRTSRHLPYPTMATMLLKMKTGESALFVFNPITGYPLDGGLFVQPKAVKQCLLLSEPNDEFIHGLIILYDSGDVEVFPKSTLDVAIEQSKSLYMYVVDPITNLMTGLSFHSPSSKILKSNAVWTIQLPEKVIAVVGKRSGEKVHSQGRVLGDRSVLYKYINPNLIVCASIAPDTIHKSVISILLVDTVSGNILFSVMHKRATEPLHIVHSENWVVYSFFNEKFRRTEIVTLDLYEGDTQRNTTVFSSLDPPLDPFIGRQAYIFPHQITSMKETITEKGITSKHVLVGLSSGGVMEVPWALLDPRRAVTPTAEMREEGVLPYIPEIALPPEAIITYNHTLIRIDGIHTSPAGLESTSLVLIYGLDLFYTRVSPSRTFDVLKDDFEYWLITAVLLGLITAAYVTKRLASRKALKQSWK